MKTLRLHFLSRLQHFASGRVGRFSATSVQLLTVVNQLESDWGVFAAEEVVEADVPATLLPIAQLELEAQYLLTRSTPQVGFERLSR